MYKIFTNNMKYGDYKITWYSQENCLIFVSKSLKEIEMMKYKNLSCIKKIRVYGNSNRRLRHWKEYKVNYKCNNKNGINIFNVNKGIVGNIICKLYNVKYIHSLI